MVYPGVLWSDGSLSALGVVTMTFISFFESQERWVTPWLLFFLIRIQSFDDWIETR